ncbi:MAG: radical SAM protein [Chitinivibrionales bacterium]|nr:radical SAM protein [Chitinivibrionales bacterium]
MWRVGCKTRITGCRIGKRHYIDKYCATEHSRNQEFYSQYQSFVEDKEKAYIVLLYLINPYNPLVSIVKSKLNRWNNYTVWKPLGLLVVAGLTPPDWEIVVFDENVDRQDYSALPSPNLVGITAFTSQADRAYTIAGEFRRRGVPVVMGGIHATMCAEEVSRYVDSLVTGEAESVWENVLNDTIQGALLPVYSGQQTNLSKTPIPRHDLLAHGYRFGSIQTTRGCPLSCNFCSVTAFNGRHYRHRPIPKIIDEYRMIRERLVLLVDDNLIGTRKEHISRTKDLLRAIIASGIQKKWIAQVTLNFGDDEELLRLASEAGCIGVFVGFETISTEGLKEIHKPFNIRKLKGIKTAVGRIHRYGISVVGSFIIGLDIDKKHIGREIASTAKHYGLDAINVLFLTPLPGTRLWDEMESSNRIILKDFPRDWRYYTLTFPVARYGHLSWLEMIEEKDACFRGFYSYGGILRRTWEMIRQLHNPALTVVCNLWYRRNTLRLDRQAYETFDVKPGEVPLQKGWMENDSDTRGK